MLSGYACSFSFELKLIQKLATSIQSDFVKTMRGNYCMCCIIDLREG
jgi:hypothetical protein